MISLINSKIRNIKPKHNSISFKGKNDKQQPLTKDCFELSVKTEIPNFNKVDKNIYRGAQPGMRKEKNIEPQALVDDIQSLKTLGISKIIDFRTPKNEKWQKIRVLK